MHLGQELELLLGDFSHLSARIRHLSYETTVCGERVEVRCSYPSFRAGEPTIKEFIDVISNHIVSFCLPRAEIIKAQNILLAGDHVKAGIVFTTMAQKAKDLFIRAQKGSSRSGEAGEIILYIFNEWLLKAPQIVSKMYLKTNNNMPVYGTDGIHARFDAETGKLHLYWGESKAHKTLNSALADALKSIKEFVAGDQEGREIDIIAAYPDFGALDSASREAFLKYLDPYSEESSQRVAIFSCLLIHELPTPTGSHTDDEVEKIYVDQVNKEVKTFISVITSKIKSSGLEMKRFEFFLLPVPSVQDLRDLFQAKIGWPT